METIFNLLEKLIVPLACLAGTGIVVGIVGLVVRLVCACFSSEIRRRIKTRPVVHAVWTILVLVMVPLAITPLRELMLRYEPAFQIYAYLLLMGMFHADLIVAAAFLAMPVLFFSRRKYWIFLRGFVVFNAMLLICGTIANLLWDRFIFGSVYRSMDYVFDFIPFFSISQNWIDSAWGTEKGGIYLGLNYFHFQAIWFAFAFATWMTAIYLYARGRRLWMKKQEDVPFLT